MQYMMGEVTEIGSFGSWESEIHNACNLSFDFLSYRNQIKRQPEIPKAIRQPHFTNYVGCGIGP